MENIGVTVTVDQAGHTSVGPPREIWHNSPRDSEPLELTVPGRTRDLAP